ncbi:glycoside hydrolase family 79 protein [Sesbania bispinosa]|nr:glycoside hydrolase family 79 protein [Sesbania bispinosa]
MLHDFTLAINTQFSLFKSHEQPPALPFLSTKPTVQYYHPPLLFHLNKPNLCVAATTIAPSLPPCNAPSLAIQNLSKTNCERCKDIFISRISLVDTVASHCSHHTILRPSSSPRLAAVVSLPSTAKHSRTMFCRVAFFKQG